MVLYDSSLQKGAIRSEDISAVFDETRDAFAKFLGKPVPWGVEILPSNEMLKAEQDYTVRLAQATERPTSTPRFIPVRTPSPQFVDHLEGKVILSDEYLYRTQSQAMNATVARHASWNPQTLEAVALDGLHNLAIREIRGETGDAYLRLFTHLPDVAVSGINGVIGNAFLYNLPRMLSDGGLPVLFFRQAMWADFAKQAVYVAMKAFADDIGLEKSALFDFMTVIPGGPGRLPVVAGFLWSVHPDFERKDAILEEALTPLNYQQERIIIPQELVRQYMMV